MLTNLPKYDLIYNALLIGMSLQDALIYAGCTEEEVAEYTNDEYMMKWNRVVKGFEYSLLEKLNTVIDKQVNRGVESALTWLLTKTNPRYTDKPQAVLPEIHMHMDNTDPKDMDNVSIHAPKEN